MMVIHRNDKFTSSSLISHVIIMAYEVECNYIVKLNGGNIYGIISM